jgi:hypothetical protein
MAASAVAQAGSYPGRDALAGVVDAIPEALADTCPSAEQAPARTTIGRVTEDRQHLLWARPLLLDRFERIGSKRSEL